MDDSLLPVTSLRENLTQAHLDFSYFRTTEPKLTPALRKMPFTNLRLTIWTGDTYLNKPSLVGVIVGCCHGEIAWKNI